MWHSKQNTMQQDKSAQFIDFITVLNLEWPSVTGGYCWGAHIVQMLTGEVFSICGCAVKIENSSKSSRTDGSAS